MVFPGLFNRSNFHMDFLRNILDCDLPPREWSILKYGFQAEGGPLCRGRDTSTRRSSPSCARWTCWLRREPRWRMLSAPSGSPRGLRDELLNGEIFYSLREAQIIIESWRCHYNSVRPHASLGYRPPAPEVFVPAFAAWPVAPPRPAPPARRPVLQRPTLN